MVRDFCRASVTGLELVDRARKQKKWNKDDDNWCTAAIVAEGTLKRFWRRSNVQRDNFNNIIRI